MPEKKKTSSGRKRKDGRAPSLNERITDFSTDSFVGEPIWTPKGTPAKNNKHK